MRAPVTPDTSVFAPKKFEAPRRDGAIVNAMSVDVEDYFQVQAFADRVTRADWDDHPSRVERNTNRVLDIFAAHNVKATFFTLGWVAERNPGLIRRIVDEGHELGSHGFAHYRVFEQSPDEFRNDVRRTKRTLEDIGGCEVLGYRAATFSIGGGNLWAFEILAEEGHVYSSSVYPVHHDLYGMPDAPRFAFFPAGEGIEEYPITTVKMGARNLPCGGGGYFRLLPYPISRWAMRKVNREDASACIFYFHPWEVDPGQPKMPGISAKTRVRHYLNLSAMDRRLNQLCRDFAWDRMDRVFYEPPSQKTAAA